MKIIRFYILFFVITSYCVQGSAQQQDLEFDKVVDSILISKPSTYKEINNYLRNFRRDTTKLNTIIKIFEDKNYPIGKSYAQNLLGIYYRNISESKKSIEIHKQALKTAEEAESLEFRVFSLNMLGVDYRKIDANRTALDYNQEALALAETDPNPGIGLRRSIAVSHNSMGNIYLLLKQYDLALQQFNKSQKIERSFNNRLGLAINNQNIGYAKEMHGLVDEALVHYRNSLNINHQINNKIGIVICNSSIARLYIKQKNPAEAVQIIQENLPLSIGIGNQEYISTNYVYLGWAQTQLKRYTEAEKNLLKGLEIAQQYDISSVISEAYDHLSELAEKKHDYKNSLMFHRLAEEFDEKITDERTTQYVNDLIIKYDTEKKNNEIKELASQNEIATLNLAKNKNIWLISVISLLSLGLVLYILYRHQLLNNEKRILTLEQELLRIQMNPHFIFNALNSIKLYIINNEQKNAVHYLNKFSKLIRKILDASSIKETTLLEELETMDLYLSIENIRFSNEINYEKNVDPSIDLSSIKVPPLVLQPFLENAIWHGLSSKKGPKNIIISIQQSAKGFIEIHIEDNGIGRLASAKIKSKKVIHRKSIGIDLTKERLTNFVKNSQNTFSLTYDDLKDMNQNALGTKLVLQIPII